ncbi:MAG: hypothetical protein EHM20_06665 [Alphaproteobacteria bacterium]|nr:MAG: hypothetical protein EHM20_06665 [Alphaproteobacteria bacterium]
MYRRGIKRAKREQKEVVGIWKSAADWSWLERVTDYNDVEEDEESGQVSYGRNVNAINWKGEVLFSFKYLEMPEKWLVGSEEVNLHFFTSRREGTFLLSTISVHGVTDGYTFS